MAGPRDPHPMIHQSVTLLDNEFPLSLLEPFTYAQARAVGISRRRLRNLLAENLIRRLLPGVYIAAQVPDSQLLRARAISLLVRNGQVVTDESAGWLAGAEMILRPGAHLAVPPLTICGTDGHGRLRNALSDSGTRQLIPEDITEIHGVRVTTPLRTALDLGRLRHRDRAIAALDQLLRLDRFDKEELLEGIARFRGFRGVRQLRVLAPLADPRSESPGESVLRLRFHDAVLPAPTPQVEIRDEFGQFLARGDLVIEELRFLAEYDGGRWHGPTRTASDERRRARLEEAGWIVSVFHRADLFGRRADAAARLRSEVREARARLGTGRGEPEWRRSA